MSAQALRQLAADVDQVGDYSEHCEALGLHPPATRARLVAARQFLDAHGDVAAWMQRPLDARLNDLERVKSSWPFVGFVLLSSGLPVDVDFLAAKHLGRSFTRAMAVIHADDHAALVQAAARLCWAEAWRDSVLGGALTLAVAFTGRPPASVTFEDLERLRAEVKATPYYTAEARHAKTGFIHSLGRLFYEARFVDRPPVHRRGEGPGNLESRLSVVAAPEMRRVMLAYLETRQAVLKVATIRDLASSLASFGEFVSERFPELRRVKDLERSHIEAFCAFLPTRRWRGQRACDRQVSRHTVIATLIDLRSFLEDIRAWGWAEAPRRQLLFASDVPRPPRALPRALPPDVDAALTAAVGHLDDRFARIGLTVLRGTGMRIGELLDLELDCVADYGRSGSWLRVPLGKLDSERSVPLDDVTLAAIEEWKEGRDVQRALPHPDGRMVDFLFVERGRRPGSARIERGLRDAVRAAGIVGTDGEPLRVVSHQLRHTYATTLVNAGMSIQGLMALLGHKTPEMTLRYATLASPTLRRAYDEAAGKLRPRIPVAPAGRPATPDKVSWLASEMLKTRVAHGYCAREIVAEACPYANVCESCAYFVTAPEFTPVLERQLADVEALRDDARARGWDAEVARHERVMTSLEGHLRRLGNSS